MRVIKFRIWDGTEGCYERDSSFWIYQSGAIDHDYKKHNDLVVEQYTGLKDKNGKEIYEGDIVSAEHETLDFRHKENRKTKKYNGIIHWNHSYWAIGEYKLFIMEDDSTEIIGNIHENPELLKQ